MVTVKKGILLLLLSVFLSACSGNYKSSDERYRQIGQPPLVIDNKVK